MFRDIVLRNRSCRRFYQDFAVSRETLEELVDLARCAPSGGNRQPLKFIISCEPEKNELIFQLIRFARKNPEEQFPPEGERPSAYIIIMLDTEISKAQGCDHGIAGQTILLGATEKGLGGCMVGLVAKDEMMAALGIPEKCQILLVVALGKPKEEPVIVDAAPGAEIRSYWDEAGVRRVPKRTLSDIIIASYPPSK